jgi:hypothetical protein
MGMGTLQMVHARAADCTCCQLEDPAHCVLGCAGLADIQAPSVCTNRLLCTVAVLQQRPVYVGPKLGS